MKFENRPQAVMELEDELNKIIISRNFRKEGYVEKHAARWCKRFQKFLGHVEIFAISLDWLYVLRVNLVLYVELFEKEAEFEKVNSNSKYYQKGIRFYVESLSRVDFLIDYINSMLDNQSNAT